MEIMTAMLEIWRDIDAKVAEARLYGLRRRLSELDAAISDHQALSREFPASFALELSGKSLRSMELALTKELAETLQHRQAELFSIALDGPSFVHHSAKISELGFILTSLQKLFSSIAQSVTTGPTSRGPIPIDIRSRTSLTLRSTYQSSFGMEIIVPASFDLFGASLPSDTLTQLFKLLKATENDAEFMRLCGEIGSRSLVHLRRLVKHLRSADSALRLAWKDFSGTKYEWSLVAGRADRVLDAINNISETKSSTIELSGLLVGASLLRNRFEILLDDGNVVEGKFVAGLTRHIADKFGKKISATVDETEILDRATGQSRTFYTLKDTTDAQQQTS